MSRLVTQGQQANASAPATMATFSKSSKNSRDLRIGYGQSYPLELQVWWRALSLTRKSEASIPFIMTLM